MRVFEERQWFNQWWLWLMLIVVFGIMLIEPIKKISDGGAFTIDYLDVGFWIGFIVTIGAALLFRLLVLHTIMDERGITYQFLPFHSNEKHIIWDEIKKCYVRKYKPLLEYGGWGMRMGSKGGAYNVRGNYGIQIEFHNGTKLLIGTQKPKEAENVINRYFRNEGI